MKKYCQDRQVVTSINNLPEFLCKHLTTIVQGKRLSLFDRMIDLVKLVFVFQ